MKTIEDVIQEFFPGAEIWCYDAGNKEYYKNTVHHVDVQLSVTEGGVVNRLGFLCVYFNHRYNGRFGKDICWSNEKTLRKNKDEVVKNTAANSSIAPSAKPDSAS